jgi:cbb3-type cytochrome oxidase subunit 3
MTPPETTAGSLAWIEAALVIFFVVFVIISLGAIFRRHGHFDQAARIPLNDGEPHPDDSAFRHGDAR